MQLYSLSKAPAASGRQRIWGNPGSSSGAGFGATHGQPLIQHTQAQAIYHVVRSSSFTVPVARPKVVGAAFSVVASDTDKEGTLCSGASVPLSAKDLLQRGLDVQQLRDS